MSNLLSLKSKYFLGVMIGIASVVAFAMFATSALAYTQSVTLRQGSTGPQVVALQQALGGLTADGNFGPLTNAAVVAYQTANGLTPDGVVGPATGAALAGVVVGGTLPAGCTSASGFSITTGGSCATVVASTGPCSGGAAFNSVTGASCSTTLPAGCTTTAGFSPTTGASCSGTATPATSGPLAGTAGNVAYSQLSQYSSEEVGSGVSDIKVAGFELEASDGDVSIRSFKLTFRADGNASTDSDRLIDYLDSVSIWQGTTKIGTVSTADFIRDSAGVYSKVVTVSNAIVRDGDKDRFYVTVDAASNIDSGDIDSDSWGIDIINVRYEDGSGVVSTDTITQTEIPILFVTSATATDTKLKVALNNTPDASSVQVDSSNNTDGVVLLKGKLTAEGTSDVWVDALPITFTAATTSGSINAITGSVSLTLGNNTYTESTGTNCVDEDDFSTAQTCSTEANEVAGVLFDELDYTIPAGTTVNFTISADINDLDATVAEATNFDAGDSLKAELTGAGREFLVAQNALGDSLVDSTEMTGTALGEVQTFYEDGIAVTFVSSDADAFTVDAVDNDRVELVIVFDVEAFGDNAYIPSFQTPTTAATNATTGTAASSTAPTTASGVAFHVQSADTGLTIAYLGSTLTSTATEKTNSFEVVEGDTKRFTLKVTVTNTATSVLDSASVRALLAGINFGNSDSATGDFVYTSDLTDTFKTPYATIAD